MTRTVAILNSFAHQVGGSSPLLTVDKDTICKILDDREKLFYNAVPSSLSEFVAAYKGRLLVEVDELDAEGSVRFLGHFEDYQLQFFPHLRDVGSIDHHFGQSIEDGEDIAAIFENPASKAQALNKFNQHLGTKVCKTEGNLRHFAMLENLTAPYDYPCVMDLKMGQRTHADTDDADKVKLKTQRAKDTTSATLGFRVCGMQVYQSETGKFLSHDKYWGRTLTETTVCDKLSFFLSARGGGASSNLALILGLIDTLQRLTSTIEDLPSYRFFSSSLLLLYDGSSQSKQPVSVKLCDFAHTTYKDCGDSTVYEGPDSGLLFGLRSLVSCLQRVAENARR